MPILSEPGFFRYTADPGEAFDITGIGPIRREDDAVGISEATGAPNTCHVTVGDHEGTIASKPEVGQTVDLSSLGRALFVGTVVETVMTYEADKLDHLKWFCDLNDPTWQFNRLIPFGTFDEVSASTVVNELVGDFAPGFTVAHVESGLADISLDLDGSLTFSEVMDEICRLLGGATWKMDYDFDLHLTVEDDDDEPPEDIDDACRTIQLDPPIRFGRSLTQIRTRVYVRGTGCFAMVEDVAKQTALALLVGGDGVWEGPVVSRPELLTEDECTTYGEALLEVYGSPLEWVQYDTRDPRTAAGKKVTFNLTNPPIVGDFRIQSVQISRVAFNNITQPRYTVRASSVVFTLEDVLRRKREQSITGNAGTASKLQTARVIHGTPFDGSQDIDLSPRLFAEQGLRVLQ